MLADEEKFTRCAAVGVYVSVDVCRSATRADVNAAIEAQLLIPSSEMEVSLFPPAGFVIVFSDSRLRDHAMDYHHGVDLVGAKLHFRPWSCMVNAAAANLSYKVRLCIEGVPLHARQPYTVKQLFHPDTLVECIDRPCSDRESACCCVKLWTSNPDGFALEGGLNLHESVHRGGHGHPWHGPVNLLGYEVVLHLDYILDYSPPATSNAAWPKRVRFDWTLGIRDDHCMPTARRHVRAPRPEPA